MELSDVAKAAKAAYFKRYQKEYRSKFRDEINKYQRKWRRNNPDKVAKYNSDYWQKKANTVTIEEQAVALRNQGYSIRDIGALLNIPKTTVSRIIQRGTGNGTSVGQNTH